jgi:hypothetical protein
MRMLADSGLVQSLEIAELNPLLDQNARTASLMVDLAPPSRPTTTRSIETCLQT